MEQLMMKVNDTLFTISRDETETTIHRELLRNDEHVKKIMSKRPAIKILASQNSGFNWSENKTFKKTNETWNSYNNPILQKPDKLTTLDRLKLTTLLPTQIDHPFFPKKHR